MIQVLKHNIQQNFIIMYSVGLYNLVRYIRVTLYPTPSKTVAHNTVPYTAIIYN